MTTINKEEIQKFSRIAEEWWDANGKFKPLHVFNPIRIKYIKDKCISHFRLDSNKGQPLSSLEILDIGCGGGLLAEPMARLGASVTGIDVTDAAIIAAKAHAETMRLGINYQTIAAEELAESGVIFDVIYASEVIEHVVDRPIFVKAISQMLAPNGLVIITTINRSLPALIFAKLMLEYIVQLVPAGTHDPQKFVKPNELRTEFINAGILLDDMTGFAPRPGGGFRPTNSLAVNYAASGGFR